MSNIIGIDPGLSGAIGIIGAEGGQFLNVSDMPVMKIMMVNNAKARVKNCVNAKMLYDLLKLWELYGPIKEVWIEHVSSRPGDGVASAFSFGDTFGSIKAVTACLGLSSNLVRPQVWKKHFGLTADKEEARLAAITLVPGAEAFLSRKKDHDRAEALLIALYGLEKHSD